MKPYLVITGLLFAGIALTHTYLAFTRDHVHRLEIILVAVSTALTLWAVRLLKSAAA